MGWWFGITTFLSAALLFLVQPMIGKMLLPLLGGAPAVWITCMVFFQAALLAGYAYAHWTATCLGPRLQVLLHAGLLLVGAATLPVAVSDNTIQRLAAGANPSLWLLGCLVSAIGLPFFVLAGNTPLLQRWFARTNHADAGDPYFLYSASNLGSLIALLSYPILVESNLRLRDQSLAWTCGYGALALLILGCALPAWRARATVDSVSNEMNDRAEKPAWGRRFRWLALAFVPSSLMLGATNYLTTDIASIPLLWIIPLAIYLVTYVLAFARGQSLSLAWFARALPTGAVALVFLILCRATHPVLLLVALHLAFLFVAAAVCHGQLAADRPHPRRLTEFFLWISAGGALGGLFNAWIAPHLFKTVAEYPLVIVLACLLRPKVEAKGATRGHRLLDVAFPMLLGTLTAGLVVMVPAFDFGSVQVRNAVIFGVPAIVAFTFVDRRLRFGLGLGAMLVAGWFQTGAYGQTTHVERSFFGVSRVTVNRADNQRQLVHGNTLHGRQFVDESRACEPLAYYHRTGPLGDVFKLFNAAPASTNVAVIGLGAGSMASYAVAGQRWTFYEIDPVVIRVAQDTNYFTFLGRCAAAEIRIVPGDARLRLREAPPTHYGLIVLDAFSSDAIPVHLLTREAVELYLAKLAPGGVLAFHISNRYLDLEPVVGDVAASMKLVCRSRDDFGLSEQELRDGKEESHWVVLARQEADLGILRRNGRWQPVAGGVAQRAWTDDFSTVLGVFKWK